MEKINRVLITGVTGFIGRHVAQRLAPRKLHLVGLARPETSKKRLESLEGFMKIVKIDLSDISSLTKFLQENEFDAILHIGAIRGGRRFPKKKYYEANVLATEQLMLAAWRTKARFVFCSSVGVFGAIPNELPANDHTERQFDSYYHETKIHAEAIVQKMVLEGLDGYIIRPAITYGPGDYGFPYTLTKLVDKRLLFLPDRTVRIHLTEVNTLADVFVKSLEAQMTPGSAFIVADRHPVSLLELADEIHEKLHGKPYPRNRIISAMWFRLGERIAMFMKNDLWLARFRLISQSWFYDVEKTYEVFNVRHVRTLAGFKSVLDFYRK